MISAFRCPAEPAARAHLPAPPPQTYGAKVAVVELPFGFVSSETVGGAGGT